MDINGNSTEDPSIAELKGWIHQMFSPICFMNFFHNFFSVWTIEKENGKRYENALMVMFDQWPKLCLGLDAVSTQKIFNGI